MSRATLYGGDVRAVLAGLPAGSIQCVVTSPPYWGLRDYQTPAQIWGGDPEHRHEWKSLGKRHRGGPTGKSTAMNGRAAIAARDATADILVGQGCECGAWLGHLGLEPTPELYAEHMVEVFRLIRTVLADDGVLWLNMGDSYVDGGRGKDTGSTLHGSRQNQVESRKVGHRQSYKGLRPKNLVGLPWRLAFALQADGWYLRGDQIVQRRLVCPCGCGHAMEVADQDAGEVIWAKPNPMPESALDRPTRSHEYLFLLAKSQRYAYHGEAIREACGRNTHDRGGKNAPAGWDMGPGTHRSRVGRYSSGITERKVADGTDGRLNTHLGRAIPWTDNGQGRNARSIWTITTQPFAGAHFATFPEELVRRCILAGSSVGDTVLDPFGGSGTTPLVATNLGRSAVYIDLSPAYLELARTRLGALICEVVA